MPPAQKFTRAEIITAALNLVRREGMSAITARGLGAELGVSSRPIFTAFRNMEEVQQATIFAAREVYDGYTARGLAENPSFKGVGMQYYRFAMEEPKLFELLFMNAQNAAMAMADVLPAIDSNCDKIFDAIQTAYGFSRTASYTLYQALWILTHGLACLCATGVCRMSEDEVSRMLTEVFTGMFIKLKSEEKEHD